MNLVVVVLVAMWVASFLAKGGWHTFGFFTGG
jgi:hypothetical protein